MTEPFPISGSSVELQSLSGKEGSEKQKQDSNLTGRSFASINLDQTIGMDATFSKTLQEKEEIPEENKNLRTLALLATAIWSR